MRAANLKQRSPEWLEWRRQGVTASDAAVVLGKSPYKTIWRLWAEKRGIVREPDVDDNPHVQRGVAFEDAARQQFEEKHETLLLPVCGESEEHPVIRASFDGLTDEGCPVELKCPAEKNFAEIAKKGVEAEVFHLYLPQLQHQIYVAEADKGWMAFYFNGRLKEFEIGRDQALIDQIVEASLCFWEMVEKGKEPELDPERDLFIPQGKLAGEWTWKASQYKELVETIESCKKRLQELDLMAGVLEQWFIAQLGDHAQGEYAGIRVKKWLQRGSVDYRKALKELLPDLKEEELERFRRKASERSKVQVVEGTKKEEVVPEKNVQRIEKSLYF